MCGGLSQNEVCSIRRDTNMDPILLAADQILSPREFVMGLKEVNILGKWFVFIMIADIWWIERLTSILRKTLTKWSDDSEQPWNNRKHR